VLDGKPRTPTFCRVFNREASKPSDGDHGLWSSSTNPLFALSRNSDYGIAIYLDYRDDQIPLWWIQLNNG
jgi:hypothetical protein